MNSVCSTSVFAAIYIPNFCLQAQIRLRPQLQDHGRAAALLDDNGDIVERNDDAARFHVELGMSATHAQARCEGIELLYANPEDEAEAQIDLLICAESFTADFESTANGVATLDLFSNPNRNHKRLGREIVDWLAGAKLPAQVGIAANPDLALLTAKLARPVEVVRGDREAIRKFLAPLPVSSLDPPKETRDVLALWGVRTLGDFMMLPRHEITERLGRDAGELWDHASGTRRRLLRLVRPSADYSQATNLDYEIATLEPALFWIQRALEVISARLAANYLVAERLTLTLTYNDGGAYQREFRIPDPCRDRDLLFRILQTHLEDFEARAPISNLQLQANATKPLKHQFKLFESSLRDPNRFGETLARLEALLGSSNVGVPELLPASKPDAFRVAPFDPEAVVEELENPGAIPPTPIAGLPLRRFRPPRPVLVSTRDRSAYPRPQEITNGQLKGPVRNARGPWLSSGDWWDRFKWARQEWDVELCDGEMYRLVYEDGKWELDGVYG